jgi:hypothetical protein
MTVYVDDARMNAPHLIGGLAKWSHMTADTRDELHEFAARLGMARHWFQDHPRLWHYDVVEKTRQRAIEMGAQSVSVRELVRLTARREGLAR